LRGFLQDAHDVATFRYRNFDALFRFLRFFHDNSMIPSLYGVRAKISQAEHHLRNLKVSLKKRLASETTGDFVRIDDDRERKHLIGRANIREPAFKWRLLVGDIAHNLRSSLDHLVYQLALLKNPLFKHGRRTMFPIFTDKEEFRSKGMHRIRPHLSFSAAKLIVKHQPYKRPNPTRDNLWILSELDNIDKHRTVVELGKYFNLPDIILTSSVTGRSKRHVSSGRHEFRPLKDRDEVFVVSYASSTDGPPKVDLDGLSALVTFEGTDLCDVKNVLPLLRDLVATVKDIVDEFDANFFSQGKDRSSPRL
jgi:hypothetical protein